MDLGRMPSGEWHVLAGRRDTASGDGLSLMFGLSGCLSISTELWRDTSNEPHAAAGWRHGDVSDAHAAGGWRLGDAANDEKLVMPASAPLPAGDATDTPGAFAVALELVMWGASGGVQSKARALWM